MEKAKRPVRQARLVLTMRCAMRQKTDHPRHDRSTLCQSSPVMAMKLLLFERCAKCLVCFPARLHLRRSMMPLPRDWQSSGHQRADVMVLGFRPCGPFASRSGPTNGTERRFFNGLSPSIRWQSVSRGLTPLPDDRMLLKRRDGDSERQRRRQAKTSTRLQGIDVGNEARRAGKVLSRPVVSLGRTRVSQPTGAKWTRRTITTWLTKERRRRRRRQLQPLPQSTPGVISKTGQCWRP
jgi:hypothetical protein